MKIKTQQSQMKRFTDLLVQDKIITKIIPLTMIVLGGLFFITAVAMIMEQVLPPEPSIAVIPLTEGTYVPAQVVFKVKPGADANATFAQAVSVQQTVYQQTSTGKVVSLYATQATQNPTQYKKTTLTLTTKNVQRLFPDVKISDAVRQKILRRNSAHDPATTFAQLGMDRWYIAVVNQSQADVAQLIHQLKVDTNNIEIAEPNAVIHLDGQLALTDTGSKLTEGNDASGTGTSAGGSNNSIVTGACTNPNDPYSCKYGDVYGGMADQWWLNTINARDAWTMTKGSKNTIIAIADTGVDTQHADLKNKIWLNAAEDVNSNGCADYWPSYQTKTDCHGNVVTGDINGIDNDGNWYADDLNGLDFMYEQAHPYQNDPINGPADVAGHGTAVAGIAAATTDTATPEGVAGTCPDCLIMPLRIGTSVGQVDTAATARSVAYAAENGADIINMSFGGDDNFALQIALTQADNLGVVLIAASGNDNANLEDGHHYPATDTRVIAVGAVGYPNDRMYFSTPQTCQLDNSAANSGSAWGDHLSVVAPGVNIMTTMGFGSTGTMLCGTASCMSPSQYQICGIAKADSATRSGYFYDTGTSFAAPVVSGVVGLLRTINPALNSVDIRDILQSTSHHDTSVLNEYGQIISVSALWNKYSGYGLVDAAAAVREAKNRQPDFRITITPEFSPAVATATNTIKLDVCFRYGHLAVFQ